MKSFIIATLAAVAVSLDHEGLIGGGATARTTPIPRPVQQQPQRPPQQRPQRPRPPMNAPVVEKPVAPVEVVEESPEVDLAALVANNTSPPTPDQLLNILASKMEGFVNPSGELDTSGLYTPFTLPRKIVGRRSRTGAEFGCYWPADMKFWGPEYEMQSAYCKSEQIWERVLEDDRMQDWFDGITQLPIFNQDTNGTFDWVGDDMPEGRLKIVHTRGTVTRVSYESVGDHPYTGIFKGADYGIMRISEVNRTIAEVQRTSPGFGLKWLRDGVPSANGVAMFSFAGQPSFNFLANSWTTHLAEPQNVCGRMTISSKFAEGTRHLGNTSVMEWAETDQFGYREPCAVWPFMLRFEPTVSTAFPDTYQADFHEQMMLLKDHMHLWDVYALDEPIGLGGEEKLVGQIHTESLTTTSLWGDMGLFFKHGRFNDDMAKRPEWYDHVEVFEDPLWRDILPLPQQKPVEGACPFEWLFGLNVFA